MQTIQPQLPKSITKIVTQTAAGENTQPGTIETVNYESPFPHVLHKLTGELPDPINMAALNIDGNIDAVGSFLTNRKDVLPKDASYILIDRNNKTVTLIVDEKHPHKTTVTGKVELNPELSKFGINDKNRYSPADLAELIKLNRYFFHSHEQHQQLLKNLKNTAADINSKLKDSTDDRGNLEKSLTTSLQTNIDERFTLEMGLFKGGTQEKVKFEVNICMEVRNAGISIWLISVELRELIAEKTEKLFDAKVEEYKGSSIVVIEK